MGTFCGPQMPDPLTTTSNFMYLKFVTDGSVQNQGFEASYEIAEGGSSFFQILFWSRPGQYFINKF